MIFPGKTGGSGVRLCNGVEGAVFHSLEGEQWRRSCVPLPYTQGLAATNRSFTKRRKRLGALLLEARLNWAPSFGGGHSSPVTMGMRLLSWMGE